MPALDPSVDCGPDGAEVRVDGLLLLLLLDPMLVPTPVLFDVGMSDDMCVNDEDGRAQRGPSMVAIRGNVQLRAELTWMTGVEDSKELPLFGAVASRMDGWIDALCPRADGYAQAHESQLPEGDDGDRKVV